jgi:hypothetical protein
MILWGEKFKFGFALEHFFLQVGFTPCVEVEATSLSMLTKT